MNIRAISQPNIALIKYWGNRNDTLRIPAADSLSMTLDAPSITVTLEQSDALAVHSFTIDKKERKLSQKEMLRFEKHFELMYEYAQTKGMDYLPTPVRVRIDSEIPESIGLASSAALFSAISRGYAEFFRKYIALNERDISILSRLGSGSASRSTFGGFVAMKVEDEGIQNAYAEQLFDEYHWPLHDIIIAPSTAQKKVGSTEGHAIASTSPHWKERLQAIPDRMKECQSAILTKDFEKLQRVAEIDTLDMHTVMQTSATPLEYLSEETHRIIKDIKTLRSKEHLEVLYTMDAGPTVHLICTDAAKDAVLSYAKTQTSCTIFETSVGAGSKIIP